MPTQTVAGKAFEYAILKVTYDLLSINSHTTIIDNSSYNIAKDCFDQFKSLDQDNYLKASKAAILHIIELEPRLQYPKNKKDVLTLQIAPDYSGSKGDVRDVLFIRSLQNWEIGISAKNNHHAVKHSRLSETIDFGKEWFEVPCSPMYFTTINDIFSELRLLKTEGKMWRDLANKAGRFYIPLLEAFKKEILSLDRSNPNIIPSNLLKYLIGNHDFYKIIKRNKKTEIYGFNFAGTLNKSIGNIKPKFKVPMLKLPSRIIELDFKPGSKDTLFLICDEGWQISFRIHNASSAVEPSLKFDINLKGQPPSLYSHHNSW